jgi:hypothetical protein
MNDGINDGSCQDLDPVEQMVLLHDKMLGVRYPGGGSSGYIDDMSDGDDEDSDSDQNGESEEEEVATAADVWSRCAVRDYTSCGCRLINKLAVTVGSQSLPSLLNAV